MKRLFFSVQNQPIQFSKMKPFYLWFVAAATGIFLVQSCNDPTLLGSDLLEQDQAEVDFADTFSLSAKTEIADSVLVYLPGIANQSNYLWGNYEDPFWGRSEAGIYVRLASPFVVPEFVRETVDSIVLLLPYDSASTYGDTKHPFKMEVLELDENMDSEATYYSDVRFSTKSQLAAESTFTPNLVDSVSVMEPENGKMVDKKLKRHLRIKMTDDFVQRFTNPADSSMFLSDTALYEKFKGFYLKAGTLTPGMLSFSLTDDLAGFSVYYRKDTLSRRYEFNFQRVVVPTFEHEYTGAVVEPFVNGQSGDSLIFLQGMQGLSAKIILPDLSAYKDRIVHKAELEFTIADLPGDDRSKYPLIDQLILRKIQGDSTKANILDANLVLGRYSLNEFKIYFGGGVSDDAKAGVKKYKMNISAFLQDYIRGKESEALYLEVYQRSLSARRAALYGAKHTKYPAKLKIYFTRSTI